MPYTFNESFWGCVALAELPPEQRQAVEIDNYILDRMVNGAIWYEHAGMLLFSLQQWSSIGGTIRILRYLDWISEEDYHVMRYQIGRQTTRVTSKVRIR